MIEKFLNFFINIKTHAHSTMIIYYKDENLL